MSRTETGLKQVVRAFFNGTGIAFCYEITEKELMKNFEEANADKTFSTDDLDECFREMAKMENDLNSESKNGMVDEEVYERVADIYGIDVPEFIITWFSSIHLLLKHGRINNDENFGFLTIDGQSLRESVDVEQNMRKQGYCFNLKGNPMTEQIEIERAEREKRELAVKAKQAEKVRLQLEKEAEIQQRKIELAKAEEKRKAEEVKTKAKATSKEASKRNIPPFPPNMKERGKQDSTMVCNKKAQLDWLKKHVPNWDGVLWNKKQANKYIDDIKKGIDVIVCDRIPIAEGFAVYNDDCEGLVQAEASTADAYNL